MFLGVFEIGRVDNLYQCFLKYFYTKTELHNLASISYFVCYEYLGKCYFMCLHFSKLNGNYPIYPPPPPRPFDIIFYINSQI